MWEGYTIWIHLLILLTLISKQVISRQTYKSLHLSKSLINFRTKICGTCHSGQMTLWWCALLQQPRRFALCWNWQGLEGTPFFLGQLHATFDSLAELLKKVILNEIDALHFHHHFNFGFFTYQCQIIICRSNLQYVIHKY